VAVPNPPVANNRTMAASVYSKTYIVNGGSLTATAAAGSGGARALSRNAHPRSRLCACGCGCNPASCRCSGCRCSGCCGSRTRTVTCAAGAVDVPPATAKIVPNGPRVVVKVGTLQAKTLGGILLPDSSQKKPTSGDVVAVGRGAKHELVLKEGETVLYSKFGIGVTDVAMRGEEYALLFERDCLGIMPRSDSTVEDVAEIKPLGDRVLIRVDDAEDETSGGVILTDTAKEKPMTGEVMAVGTGKVNEVTGETSECKLKVGEKILFFKWAGDAVTTSAGTTYNIISESDILCRL